MERHIEADGSSRAPDDDAVAPRSVHVYHLRRIDREHVAACDACREHGFCQRAVQRLTVIEAVGAGSDAEAPDQPTSDGAHLADLRREIDGGRHESMA